MLGVTEPSEEQNRPKATPTRCFLFTWEKSKTDFESGNHRPCPQEVAPINDQLVANARF